MLRSTSLVVSLASGALAAVGNVCVQQPYNLMLGFKDYEPAKAYCAPHFPAHTITKTLPPRCLTTTSTVVLGTSTVTTTSSPPCHTPDPLELQEVTQLERRADPGSIEGLWWEGKSWWSEHHSSDKHRKHPRRATHCETSKQCPRGEHCWHDKQRWWHDGNEHWWHGGEEHWWHHGGRHWHHREARGQCVPNHWHKHPHPPPPPPPHHHHPHPPPEESSGAPMPTHNVAKRTPVGHVKRDAMATKSAEWLDYQANLIQCGYDCIQTACSCVAATKIEYRTPVPTCTETKTKQTVIHMTTTVVGLPKGCEHGDLRRDLSP